MLFIGKSTVKCNQKQKLDKNLKVLHFLGHLVLVDKNTVIPKLSGLERGPGWGKLQHSPDPSNPDPVVHFLCRIQSDLNG